MKPLGWFDGGCSHLRKFSALLLVAWMELGGLMMVPVVEESYGRIFWQGGGRCFGVQNCG